MSEFHTMDFNGESSFEAVKVLSLIRALYESLDWKFSAWTDEVLERCWPQISSEHDDVSHSRDHKVAVRFIAAEYQVRAYISEFLAFSGKIKVLFHSTISASHIDITTVATQTFNTNS